MIIDIVHEGSDIKEVIELIKKGVRKAQNDTFHKLVEQRLPISNCELIQTLKDIREIAVFELCEEMRDIGLCGSKHIFKNPNDEFVFLIVGGALNYFSVNVADEYSEYVLEEIKNKFKVV